MSFEQHVVILIGLEGRIKVDEIHRLVLDIAAENVKVIAVVESVHGRFGRGT